MVKTIKHYFPNLSATINSRVKDLRDARGKKYSMHEAVISVVVLFLLKEGSRNSFNQDRAEPKFKRNIRRLLKVNLMHGDSFNDVLALVDEDDLQILKARMVKILIAHKVFYSFRHHGKYIVAIDGTGTQGFDEDYSGKCLHKTSKNGVTSYSQAVLEAKLVAGNGFCISLVSTWLENNQEGQHDKQDCELAAFKRLADKIKKLYPRLPVIIVGDALYANCPVMDICKARQWDFLLVIKEGVLKELNEEIRLRPDKKSHQGKGGKLTYLQDLVLGVHQLSWLNWKEACNSFSWITNIDIQSVEMGIKLQESGRLRWKIENEGFNTQKNLGYNLEHKYSRIDFNATKNYYQCMQIAHMIEQLTLLAKHIKCLLQDGKTSIVKISERLRNMLVYCQTKGKTIERLLEKKIQIRFG